MSPIEPETGARRGQSRVFRRTAWRRKTFLASFAATLALVSVIIVGSSFVYYRTLERATIEQINAKSIESLVRTKSVFSAINLWMTATVRRLLESGAIRDAMDATGPDAETFAGALRELSETERHYRWIHSMYLYNGSTRTLVSTPGGFEDRPYTDPDLLSLVLNPVRPAPFTYEPRVLRLEAAQGRGFFEGMPTRPNVLTLYFGNATDADEEPTSWLVVNLDEQRIRDDFFSRYVLRGEELMVFRRTGVVISHPDSSLFRLDISSRTFVGRILSMVPPEGSFLLSSPGTSLYVSYAYYEELDWYLVTITDEERILAPLREVRRRTFLLIGTFLSVAILAAFVISRLIYSPIDGLLRFALTVRKRLHVADGVEPARGDLQFVSDVFHRVAESATVLSAQRERYEEVRDREALKHLLEGRADPEDIEGIDLPVSDRFRMCVVVIRLDRYRAFRDAVSDDELRGVFRYLSRYVADFTPYDHHAIDMGVDHLAVVLTFEVSGDDDSAFDELQYQLARMQEEFSHKFGGSVTVGIGNLVGEVGDLPDAYAAAFALTDERFRLGHGAIVVAEPESERDPTVSEGDELEYPFPEEQARAMFAAVRKGDVDRGLVGLDAILMGVRAFSADEFAVLLQYLRYLSIKMLFDPSAPTTVRGSEARRMIDTIDTVETIDDAQKLLSGIFRSYCAALVPKRDDERLRMVAEIDRYIGENLKDPNLSPDSVALHLKRSTNYIRRIYKELTGNSLSNRITGSRVGLCKRLLLGTQMSVKEVVEEAGFANYTNFFTTFKRITGQTPGEFRRDHAIPS